MWVGITVLSVHMLNEQTSPRLMMKSDRISKKVSYVVLSMDIFPLNM